MSRKLQTSSASKPSMSRIVITACWAGGRVAMVSRITRRRSAESSAASGSAAHGRGGSGHPFGATVASGGLQRSGSALGPVSASAPAEVRYATAFPAVLFAALLAGCGSTSMKTTASDPSTAANQPAPAPAPQHATPKSRGTAVHVASTQFGRALLDSHGLALYAFSS